ncbi:P3 protein [Rose virus R]|uniref:P3 protein n=1 Tax=Rose virus R TaxID=2805917 RepID=A0AAE7P728_9RHAB|nr:P3 protein [Rose virus R]QQZ02075.1 P3 protein [Rose virus R]
MSSISKKNATKTRKTVRHLQHSSEIGLSFPFMMTEIFSKYRYAQLSQVMIEYIPLIKNPDVGHFTLSICNNKIMSEKGKKVISVEFFPHLYQRVWVTGFDWTMRKDGSPWYFSLSTSIRSIEFGSAVGEIIFSPSFCYTNMYPSSVPLEVRVDDSDGVMIEDVGDEPMKEFKIEMIEKMG